MKNIMNYSPVGDGVADDTIPLDNALAELHAEHGGSLLIPYGISLRVTPSNLSNLRENDNWTIIRLDGSLFVTDTLALPGRYAIIGGHTRDSAGPQFSSAPSSVLKGTEVAAGSPVVSITGSANHLSGVHILNNSGGDKVGILVSDCSNVQILDCHVQFYQGVPSGIALKIKNSWGVLVRGGSFMPSSTNTTEGASITICGDGRTPPNFQSYGIRIVDTIIAQRGIKMTSTGRQGPWLQPVEISGLLYESGLESPIILDSSNQGIVGLELRRIWPADSVSVPALITNTGSATYEVLVEHPVMSVGQIVTGDAIHGLHVVTSSITTVGIGQKRECIVQRRDRMGMGALEIAEGANAAMGITKLRWGKATVDTTMVTNNSRILLTAQDNKTVGSLRVAARIAGKSFVIRSSWCLDRGAVAWLIVEPHE